MKVLLTVLLVCSSLAFADHHEGKGENFEKVKAMVSSNIDERISNLQTFKSCVSSAADREALKACRKAHKESMKKMKESNKAEREAFKDEMKSKREERRKK
jgi:gas vesicle protein